MTEYNYKFTQDWNHIVIQAANFISSGDLEAAQDILLSTLKSDPENPSLLNTYAVSLQMQEKFEESIKTFQKAGELSPRDASIWFNLGITYAKAGQLKLSLESFDKSLELDEMNLAAFHAKSQLYIHLNDYQSAINMLNKALQFSPRNLNFLKSKAIVLRNLGAYVELLETLKLISSIDKEDIEVKKTLEEIEKLLVNKS